MAIRWKAIAQSTVQYQIARKFPKYFRKALRTMARAPAAGGLRLWTSTSAPSYKPWDQRRVPRLPTGDLFKAIRKGKADVVTDTIERFTKTGIKLASGEELEADIIITATGLNMRLFGGADIHPRMVQPIDLHDPDGLQGHDAHRHARTWRFTIRLHQRVVDAEGRPGLRVRLPRAQLHGRQRLRHRRAAASRRYRRRAAADGVHTRLLSCARCDLPAEGGVTRARGGSSRTTSSTCA